MDFGLNRPPENPLIAQCRSELAAVLADRSPPAFRAVPESGLECAFRFRTLQRGVLAWLEGSTDDLEGVSCTFLSSLANFSSPLPSPVRSLFLLFGMAVEDQIKFLGESVVFKTFPATKKFTIDPLAACHDYPCPVFLLRKGSTNTSFTICAVLNSLFVGHRGQVGTVSAVCAGVLGRVPFGSSNADFVQGGVRQAWSQEILLSEDGFDPY
jgi:hypothetical protein